MQYKQNAIESFVADILIALFDNMKEKRIEIMLKKIERIYGKFPGMQVLIDESMIGICKEEVALLFRFSLRLALSLWAI